MYICCISHHVLFIAKHKSSIGVAIKLNECTTVLSSKPCSCCTLISLWCVHAYGRSFVLFPRGVSVNTRQLAVVVSHGTISY